MMVWGSSWKRQAEASEFTMRNPASVRRTILEVVDNQLRDLNPPATEETFDRLVAEGLGQDEARRLMGCVVASEIFDVLASMRPFETGS